MSSANLVAIPSCTAHQVLGAVETELGHGTLVAIADPASPKSILLQIGSAAFALATEQHDHFFTHADDERLYFFPSDHVGSGSYVKLTLPADVAQSGSTTQRLRDNFEDALLARGFLRAGPLAAADEFGRSVAQESRSNATALNSAARRHLETNAAGQVKVPDGVKSAAIAAKEATGTAAQTTGHVASVANDAVRSAGAKVASAMPDMPSMDLGEESALTTVKDGAKTTWSGVQEGASAIGDGLSQGTNELVSTASQAAQSIISHDYGDEASQTAGHVGEAGRNVGQVGADVAMGTSTIYHGTQFSAGALEGNPRTEAG